MSCNEQKKTVWVAGESLLLSIFVGESLAQQVGASSRNVEGGRGRSAGRWCFPMLLACFVMWWAQGSPLTSTKLQDMSIASKLKHDTNWTRKPPKEIDNDGNTTRRLINSHHWNPKTNTRMECKTVLSLNAPSPLIAPSHHPQWRSLGVALAALRALLCLGDVPRRGASLVDLGRVGKRGWVGFSVVFICFYDVFPLFFRS